MNSVYMTIVGLFIGGVSNIIAGTISADLGWQDAIQGNSEDSAIVTGTGSVGAALGQIIVRVIQSHFNWFYEFLAQV
jgi:OPA family glycerol-3-phosphate transporter-like MFS transporter 3